MLKRFKPLSQEQQLLATQRFGLPSDPSEWTKDGVTAAQSKLRQILKTEGDIWLNGEGRHDLAAMFISFQGGVIFTKGPER